MERETPEDLKEKERIWDSLKAVIIEDLRYRSLEESEVGKIILRSNLVDLGLRDSFERHLHGFNWLNLVHVIDELEDEFSINISHDRLLEFNTVEDIFKCLVRKVKRKRNCHDSQKNK